MVTEIINPEFKKVHSSAADSEFLSEMHPGSCSEHLPLNFLCTVLSTF